jgi:hypothetical protein
MKSEDKPLIELLISLKIKNFSIISAKKMCETLLILMVIFFFENISC